MSSLGSCSLNTGSYCCSIECNIYRTFCPLFCIFIQVGLYLLHLMHNFTLCCQYSSFLLSFVCFILFILLSLLRFVIYSILGFSASIQVEGRHLFTGGRSPNSQIILICSSGSPLPGKEKALSSVSSAECLLINDQKEGRKNMLFNPCCFFLDLVRLGV